VRGHEPESLEAALYSDLRSQQVLLKVEPIDAEHLVEVYDLANYQSVLLRAVKVIAHVRCRDPARYRALFRALKFRRLLYKIEREGEGYRIVIDGPFSLFESVTKYGLQLALVFPELRRCDELRLRAQLRWGKQRQALRFEYDHVERQPEVSSAPIADDVSRLLDGLRKLDGDWQFSLSDQVLDLPGVGLCVPDICCRRGEQCVFVEVMGFWSRDAVFKRVELVEKGLSERVLFAVSKRLRVSEAVLDDAASSALYVYKGVMSPKAVLSRVRALADGASG
jgi:predicted nuclease of restriction endonuclease-like RecB superfamily